MPARPALAGRKHAEAAGLFCTVTDLAPDAKSPEGGDRPRRPAPLASQKRAMRRPRRFFRGESPLLTIVIFSIQDS
jgi:hypothetical protein